MSDHGDEGHQVANLGGLKSRLPRAFVLRQKFFREIHNLKPDFWSELVTDQAVAWAGELSSADEPDWSIAYWHLFDHIRSWQDHCDLRECHTVDGFTDNWIYQTAERTIEACSSEMPPPEGTYVVPLRSLIDVTMNTDPLYGRTLDYLLGETRFSITTSPLEMTRADALRSVAEAWDQKHQRLFQISAGFDVPKIAPKEDRDVRWLVATLYGSQGQLAKSEHAGPTAISHAVNNMAKFIGLRYDKTPHTL